MQQGFLGGRDGASTGACGGGQVGGSGHLRLQDALDPRHELPHLLMDPGPLHLGRLPDGVEQVEGGREQQGSVLTHCLLRQRRHPARHRLCFPT